MSRQEMLEWLVQNVNGWPLRPREKRIVGDWFWIRFFSGEIFAVNVSTDEIVTHQQWLDLKSQTKCNNQARNNKC